jgi:hypothetical protein
MDEYNTSNDIQVLHLSYLYPFQAPDHFDFSERYYNTFKDQLILLIKDII